jgi:hypothetical protein
MLADVRAIIEAEHVFDVQPKDLPSMRGLGDERADEPAPVEVGEVRAAATPAPRSWREDSEHAGSVEEMERQFEELEALESRSTPQRRPLRRQRSRPTLRIMNWWTGSHALESAPRSPRVEPVERARTQAANDPASPPRPARAPGSPRPSAREQLASAQARARAARERAQQRMRGRNRFDSGPNAGIAVALLLFLAATVGLAAWLIDRGQKSPGGPSVTVNAGTSTPAEASGKVDPDAWLDQFINASARERLEEAVGALDDLRLRMEAISRREEVMERLREQGRLVADGEFEEALRLLEEMNEGTGLAEAWRAAAQSGSAAGAPPSPPASPGQSGTIFVLERVLETADDQALREVRSVMGWLRATGFRVEGLGGGEKDIEANASLLKAIGSGVATDPETQDRVRSWLESDAGEAYDAILWVELDDSGVRPSFHVISAHAYDAERLERTLRQG